MIQSFNVFSSEEKQTKTIAERVLCACFLLMAAAGAPGIYTPYTEREYVNISDWLGIRAGFGATAVDRKREGKEEKKNEVLFFFLGGCSCWTPITLCL